MKKNFLLGISLIILGILIIYALLPLHSPLPGYVEIEIGPMFLFITAALLIIEGVAKIEIGKKRTKLSIENIRKIRRKIKKNEKKWKIMKNKKRRIKRIRNFIIPALILLAITLSFLLHFSETLLINIFLLWWCVKEKYEDEKDFIIRLVDDKDGNSTIPKKNDQLETKIKQSRLRLDLIFGVAIVIYCSSYMETLLPSMGFLTPRFIISFMLSFLLLMAYISKLDCIEIKKIKERLK